MTECAIGITAAVERVRWGPWDQIVNMAIRSYAAAVQGAGGLALLIPPDPDDRTPDRLLDRIDGIVLSGGSDLDPGCYGQAAHPSVAGTWPERDRFEIALVRRALDRGIPVLGICRGMQVLNVALGGSLEQHLPDRLGADTHRHTPGAFGDHEVRLEPGSVAASAVGAERTIVKSHHHQGVGEMGEGLVATGWSDPDDVIEALELPGERFVLGVLWHPEADERSRVIGALTDAARTEVAAP